MTNQERAQNIVAKIIENLRGRQTLDFTLEQIELEAPDIYAEIQQDLINIVEKELKL